MSVGLTWLGTGMHTEHLVDDSQKEPSGPQSFKHLQDFLMEEFRLYASYWVLDDLAVNVTIPIRHTMIEAAFVDGDGNLLPGFVSIHHRNETLLGLGDVALRFTIRALEETKALPLQVMAHLGASLPTGDIEPDPFRLGASGKVHQHIFFGTGTINPALGLGVRYNFGSVKLRSNTSLVLPLVSNREGYTPPTSLTSDLSVTFPTGLGSLNAVVGTGVFQEWPAKWGSRNAKNSGRTDLIGSLGVTWDAGNGLYSSLFIKLPVFIEAKGGQLEMPLVLQLGIGGRVNLLE